jgi:hypothetical protein
MRINREMNFLNLVTPWLDNVCQIKTKILQCQNKKIDLNKALVLPLVNSAKQCPSTDTVLNRTRMSKF